MKIPVPPSEKGMRPVRYAATVSITWTVAIGASLSWSIIKEGQGTLEAARNLARSSYEKDALFLRWNARHGGEYVAVTEQTQPDPYLDDKPERDVLTPSGDRLTRMNPANMTRQVHELMRQEQGISGHLTALKPLRPENAPDPWEKKALLSFQDGATEASSVEREEGREFLRIMRPLVAEPSCLKCHAKQGYHEGELYGGISVEVPLAPFRSIEQGQTTTIAVTHGLLWIVGLSGLGFGTRRLLQSEKERTIAVEELRNAHGELERRVEERTAELEAANMRLMREVLERKKAQAALQESETRYRIIADNTYGWEFWLDPEGRFIYSSPACREITGYEADIFLADPDLLFRNIHPDDQPRFAIHRHEAEEGSREGVIAFRFIRPDGTWRWIGHVCKPVFDDGHFLGTRGSNRDITQRKQAEDALRESEARFRAIFDNAAVPIAIVDAGGCVVSVNEAGCRFLGYEREEIIGMHFSAFSPPQHREMDAALYGELVRGTIRSYEVTKRYLRKDGETVWGSLGVSLIREADGQPVYTVVVCEDITERKWAEEHIRKLNVDLEERVKQRTAQLETSNRELESFCYSVSHDLRAPLTRLEGYSQALLEDCTDSLDGECRYLAERIGVSSRQLKGIIDALLEMGRLTRADIATQEVDLSEIARAIADELTRAHPERVVDFVIAPRAVVRGDPALLHVVLENLLGNAFKFTAKHPAARIEFGTRGDGGKAAYYVKDDGAGFDMHYAHKLFKPFQRLHSHSEFDGSGIGLATVQKIIERHGGRIWATGGIEEGATFFFTLS